MEQQNIVQPNNRPLLITLACILYLISNFLGVAMFLFFTGASGQLEIKPLLILILIVLLNLMTIYLIWKMKKIGVLLFIIMSIVPLILKFTLPISSLPMPGIEIILILAILPYYKQMK